jgi:hypothetical protein
MRLTTNIEYNADDVAAIQHFREALLAQNWPDSEAIRRDIERSLAFGVWAGRDHGGYRYPPFQFLMDGSVNPKLSELMAALTRQPDLHPDHDKSGWGRAYWLYQPRGRLSMQALALHAATPREVREDPKRFAILSNDARTPAAVFPDDFQAVIDLANEDADRLCALN